MTHAVLIAATAARRFRPQIGGSLPSIVMTSAFEMLHASRRPIRSHSGVGEMRCARCSHGMARMAAGPAAKMRRDAPTNLQAPLTLLTGDVSGRASDNLTSACRPGVTVTDATSDGCRGQSVTSPECARLGASSTDSTARDYTYRAEKS